MRAKKDIVPQEGLSEENFKRFANLRRNLRLLRAHAGCSAQALGKEVGFKKYYRINDLEEGRGIPKLEEIEILAKYFNISIDDLLYKKGRIIFE